MKLCHKLWTSPIPKKGEASVSNDLLYLNEVMLGISDLSFVLLKIINNQ